MTHIITYETRDAKRKTSHFIGSTWLEAVRYLCHCGYMHPKRLISVESRAREQ